MPTALRGHGWDRRFRATMPTPSRGHGTQRRSTSLATREAANIPVETNGPAVSIYATLSAGLLSLANAAATLHEELADGRSNFRGDDRLLNGENDGFRGNQL